MKKKLIVLIFLFIIGLSGVVIAQKYTYECDKIDTYLRDDKGIYHFIRKEYNSGIVLLYDKQIGVITGRDTAYMDIKRIIPLEDGVRMYCSQNTVVTFEQNYIYFDVGVNKYKIYIYNIIKGN